MMQQNKTRKSNRLGIAIDIPDARTLFAKPVMPVEPKMAYQHTLPDKDIAGLYHSIEAALPKLESRVVQISSCYQGEGASTISMGLGELVSGTLNHKILFIDMEASGSPIEAIRKRNGISLVDAMHKGEPIKNAITESSSSTMLFDHAYITANNAHNDLLAHHDNLRQVFELLRTRYRFILLHAPNLLSNPAGIALSRLSDGVILVIEAERTRAPAAKQAIRQITDKGVNVIGLALNKRRYYIPRWLYRWL